MKTISIRKHETHSHLHTNSILHRLKMMYDVSFQGVNFIFGYSAIVFSRIVFCVIVWPWVLYAKYSSMFLSRLSGCEWLCVFLRIWALVYIRNKIDRRGISKQTEENNELMKIYLLTRKSREEKRINSWIETCSVLIERRMSISIRLNRPAQCSFNKKKNSSLFWR